MMTQGAKISASIQTPLVFTGLFVLLTFLYMAKRILIPGVIATTITIVLHPIAKLFICIGLNRVFTIIFTLFLIVLIIVASMVAVVIYSAMLNIPGMLIALTLTTIVTLVFNHVASFNSSFILPVLHHADNTLT